jgi:hypothetical protein
MYLPAILESFANATVKMTIYIVTWHLDLVGSCVIAPYSSTKQKFGKTALEQSGFLTSSLLLPWDPQKEVRVGALYFAVLLDFGLKFGVFLPADCDCVIS